MKLMIFRSFLNHKTTAWFGWEGTLGTILFHHLPLGQVAPRLTLSHNFHELHHPHSQKFLPHIPAKPLLPQCEAISPFLLVLTPQNPHPSPSGGLLDT